MSPATGTDLMRAFQDTGATLVDVHQQLAGLLALAAADPWAEAQGAERMEVLRERRDQLLRAWARQALTWTLRGGQVQLTGEAGALVGPPVFDAPPASPASHPAEEGGPEVVTRSRIVRRVYDPTGTEPVGERAEAPKMSRAEVARNLDHEKLTELLRILGEPTTPLDSPDRVREELHHLTLGSATPRLEEWASFPKPVQKALVGMVVARARHLQDEVDGVHMPSELTGDLDRIFSTMTGFSKYHQPGFVFGLQRHHHAMGLTWLADSRRWWTDLVDFLPEPAVLSPDRALHELRRRVQAASADEDILAQATAVLEAGIPAEDPRLVTIMGPKLDILKQEAKFKHLRKAVRDALVRDEESKGELMDPDAALPHDWPWEAEVDGRRVAIVGGPVPEEARKRITEIFRFGTVEWVDGDHPRALDTLAQRVRDDALDLVIVLRRFIGNDADRVLIPVCDDEGLPVADVAEGFGLNALVHALEDAFQDLEDE